MSTKVKFVKPHLNLEVGFVTDQLNEGVAKTLLYLGICEKVDEDSRLDNREKDESRKLSSKSRRGKGSLQGRRNGSGRNDSASDKSGD